MGVSSTWGFAVVGLDAVPVRVEAHARNGLPGVTIVGLPGVAVKEARERIRSAAASSGMPLPTRRITVNLSPGDIPKEGPGFDLPVALATLAACGYLPGGEVGQVAAVGELSLQGEVRSTRGVLSAAGRVIKISFRRLPRLSPLWTSYWRRWKTPVPAMWSTLTAMRRLIAPCGCISSNW